MAMFSQQHYIWTATRLREMLDKGIPRKEVNATAFHFAAGFALDNPKFKLHTFMQACGLREPTP